MTNSPDLGFCFKQNNTCVNIRELNFRFLNVYTKTRWKTQKLLASFTNFAETHAVLFLNVIKLNKTMSKYVYTKCRNLIPCLSNTQVNMQVE